MSRIPFGRLAALAAGAVIFCAPTRSDATVVRALSLAEKCAVSPVIVHGLVERVESQWDVSGANIETLISVKVLESLKGDVAGRIVVRQGGGQIGERRQIAAGMSQFEAGEEVVLFLEPLGPQLVEIGIGIGKYAVTPNGGVKWVSHNPEVAQARTDQAGHMVVEPIPPMEPMPLAQFLKTVRSHVAGIPTGIDSPRKGARLRPAPVERPLKSRPTLDKPAMSNEPAEIEGSR